MAFKRKKPLTPFQQHVKKWRGCEACDLCESRHNMVFARGKLPSDILFIGEAPGESEDVLGQPFVGPAGRMLDDLIDSAMQAAGDTEHLRMAFTNLVCCLPDKASGNHAPVKEEIHACADRLEEMIKIANPRAVVLVGALSHKWVPKLHGTAVLPDKLICIIHPAAILRSQEPQRTTACERTAVQLRDLFGELVSA